jgi:xanthine dehydrogenase accessory factor
MFHDHAWERDFIPAALATDAFYIGAIGSQATHRRRLRILSEMGFYPDQLKRIHGPAGLFSGAKNAMDVALSILSEIAQVERSLDQRDLGLETLPATFPRSV